MSRHWSVTSTQKRNIFFVAYTKNHQADLTGESNVCRKAVPVSIQLAYLCHLVLCALVFSDYRLVSVL